MHDRLDCYDDRPLNEHELRQLRWAEAAGPAFTPWWGYCIDGEGTTVIKAGHLVSGHRRGAAPHRRAAARQVR